MKNVFRERKRKLYNGETVREGDLVEFVNSDGNLCQMEIKRREITVTHIDSGKKLKKGTLFFWNYWFDILDYRNARRAKNTA